MAVDLLGKVKGLAKDRRKGHRHDRLLRDNLDRALDLDHVVSETLIEAETEHPHQAS